MGSMPGLGPSPGGGLGNPTLIVSWRMPWTEEPGGYSPWGRRVGRDWAAERRAGVQTTAWEHGPEQDSWQIKESLPYWSEL